MKKPTKKQLLAVLKKHNWVKQHAAASWGVDEKTVRRWCAQHNVDVDFEKKKSIADYEHVDVASKLNTPTKKQLANSPLADKNTNKVKGSDSLEDKRNFVFSDLQIPYHDKKALAIAVKRCEDFLGDPEFSGERYCTIIGDFMDYEPLLGKANQRYPKLETEALKALDLEFIESRKVLDQIERVLPEGTTKIFIKGNHEDRADKIIEKPDGEYWKKHIDINERLGLKASGWKVLNYNESFKLGHLHYTHGAFYNQHHAYKHAQHFAKNVMYGHTHQIQVFTLSSPVKELPVWAASIGCLANVNPEWQRNRPNAHDHAFAEVSYVGEDFFPSIYRIIRGKVVIGGKVYTA